jgi:hypothetical protein
MVRLMFLRHKNVKNMTCNSIECYVSNAVLIIADLKKKSSFKKILLNRCRQIGAYPSKVPSVDPLNVGSLPYPQTLD